MTFALNDLSALLSREDSVSGVVVQIGDGIVRVATPRGAVQARPAGSVAVGDRVVVRAGWAEPVPKSTQAFSI